MSKTMDELIQNGNAAVKKAVSEGRAPSDFEERKITFAISQSLGGNMSELLKKLSDENCLDDRID